MPSQPIDAVEFAKALADESRQKIMALCCCRWLSVGEIVEALDLSQPTVSHHLGLLRAAGLVHTRRKGKQIYYTINQPRLAAGCCILADTFAPDNRLELVEK